MTRNDIRKLLILLLLGLILAACAAGAEPAENAVEAPAAEEPELAVPEEAPAAPAAEEAGPDSGGIEAVYGIDERFEMCDGCTLVETVVDEQLAALSRSVAVLVRPQALDLQGELITWNAYLHAERIELQYGAPLCAVERFPQQPAPGFCTGFLIDEDTLLTAGHCIPDAESCANTQFVFDFRLGEDGTVMLPSQEQIYSCGELLVLNDVNDLALVRLDRPTGREGLPLADFDPQLGTALAVIGHPSGLPQKVALGASVIANDATLPYILTNLDTFAGNSGSPIISLEDHSVLGLLTGGEEDYVITEAGCMAVKVCDEAATDCSGEAVTRITPLIEAGIIP